MTTKESSIGDKYENRGPCSNAGGMGTLLFVTVKGTTEPVLVLKLCKLADPEMIARFRREVRVMQDFNGNAYVMPILDANLDNDPPYFVMPHYEQGDLMAAAAAVRGDLGQIEQIFYRMIDCIAQLHDKNVFHRDIKPQNFLLSDRTMVVSDLGLCSDKESATAFTRSSQWAGTPGYLPPEYISGGFKDADAATDIFMLGKSFYAILSGRDPMYLVADGLPPQLFPIFERCCAINKASRYQTLASLKQSLTSAFDVLLGRAVGPGKVYGLLRSILDRLRTSQQYLPEEVGRFVEELAVLAAVDQHQVCLELPEEAFSVVGQAAVQQHLAKFIAVYRGMAEAATYAWSFAENVAKNMTVLFDAPDTSATDKAEALRVAIIASVRQNRFAAMETCKRMITSVKEPELAQRVADILLQHDTHFIQRIEPSQCQAPAVRAAVETLKAAADAEVAQAKAAEDNNEIPF
ncbi:MAG: protein kinase [Burkholderiales bacterium]|nr:protein kinase [Burkholderiales bacterium]